MIKKMLEGCRRLRQRKDVRVPITLSILTRICQQLPFVTYSRYETLLFQAVYSLAYFGLFRVSELVVTIVSLRQAMPCVLMMSNLNHLSKLLSFVFVHQKQTRWVDPSEFALMILQTTIFHVFS